MLARYTIYRRRPVDAPPLPEGIRQDTRWRTRHILRPTQEMVEAFLLDPAAADWSDFRDAYLSLLDERFEQQNAHFESFAALAIENDVYLGCSCPTKKNPDVRHCHTYLALEFIKERFPRVRVIFPDVKA